MVVGVITKPQVSLYQDIMNWETSVQDRMPTRGDHQIIRKDHMGDEVHTVKADWREADAIAIEQRVAAMAEWLDHTEDLVLMFGEDEQAATELRVAAGLVKTRRNDLASRAAQLRAELADRNGSSG